MMKRLKIDLYYFIADIWRFDFQQPRDFRLTVTGEWEVETKTRS